METDLNNLCFFYMAGCVVWMIASGVAMWSAEYLQQAHVFHPQ